MLAELVSIVLMLPIVAFGSPSVSVPPPPPPPPEPPPPPPVQPEESKDVQKAMAEARQSIRRRRGRASQILAGEQRFLEPVSTESGKETLGA